MKVTEADVDRAARFVAERLTRMLVALPPDHANSITLPHGERKRLGLDKKQIKPHKLDVDDIM